MKPIEWIEWNVPNRYDTPAMLFGIEDWHKDPDCPLGPLADDQWVAVDPDLGAAAQHMVWQEPYSTLASIKDWHLEE